MPPQDYHGEERRQNCSGFCGEHNLTRKDIEELYKMKDLLSAMKAGVWVTGITFGAFITLSGFSYKYAQAVEKELSAHIQSVESEKGRFRAHIEASGKQDQLIASLNDDRIRMQSTIENIEENLRFIKDRVK